MWFSSIKAKLWNKWSQNPHSEALRGSRDVSLRWNGEVQRPDFIPQTQQWKLMGTQTLHSNSCTQRCVFSMCVLPAIPRGNTDTLWEWCSPGHTTSVPSKWHHSKWNRSILDTLCSTKQTQINQTNIMPKARLLPGSFSSSWAWDFTELKDTKALILQIHSSNKKGKQLKSN